MQTMSVDTTNSTTTIRQRLLEHPSDGERPTTTDHNRILPRDSPFHQSSGTLNIQRNNTVKSLYNQSWFYTVIHFSTWKIILLMTLLYAVLCVVFAVPYFWISSQCGLDMKTFLDALYFSLETMVTIGYGVPKDDPYLNECGYALPLIFVQSVLGCLYDAVCMGLVFSRMSRVNKRATTILFSDKAIVRFTPHGVPYFMFQVCEMRKHQLIEAHVRCYAFLRPLSTGGGSGSGNGSGGGGGGGGGGGSGSGGGGGSGSGLYDSLDALQLSGLKGLSNLTWAQALTNGAYTYSHLFVHEHTGRTIVAKMWRGTGGGASGHDMAVGRNAELSGYVFLCNLSTLSTTVSPLSDWVLFVLVCPVYTSTNSCLCTHLN
jgi:uncharacterized membrane protein YgcG